MHKSSLRLRRWEHSSRLLHCPRAKTTPSAFSHTSRFSTQEHWFCCVTGRGFVFLSALTLEHCFCIQPGMCGSIASINSEWHWFLFRCFLLCSSSLHFLLRVAEIRRRF